MLPLLFRQWGILMAIVLMPVMLNAFLVHLFLAPEGIGGAALLLTFTIIIMFSLQAEKIVASPFDVLYIALNKAADRWIVLGVAAIGAGVISRTFMGNLVAIARAKFGKDNAPDA